MLNYAADAFLAGEKEAAGELITAANFPEIREWIESLWGSAKDNPLQATYHRVRALDPEPVKLPKADRHAVRMPDAAEKALVIARDGWFCRYCGIPLVSTNARNVLSRALPHQLVWGPRKRDKHAAFQCMTPEFDHVVPHCFGGDSSLDNTVLSCGPCNCGKFDRLLAHHGLLDPRDFVPQRSDWDGLTRLLLQA